MIKKISVIYTILLLFISVRDSCGAVEDGRIIIRSGDIKPRIALAMSGGGARGFSQPGVLKGLELRDIDIDCIAGTSIGAVVGGLYAAGYSADDLDSIIRAADWDEIISLANEQDRSDLFIDQKEISDRSLLTLKFKKFKFVVPSAISVGTRYNEFLQKLVWNAPYFTDNFDSLKFAFRAVSTDLANGSIYTFKSGNLSTALRASSIFPLRFSPVYMDRHVLVDGGILSNVPVQTAKEFNPDYLIAVNTTSPLYKKGKLNTPWNIADQAVSISMKMFTDEALEQADIVIEPDLGIYPNDDFSNVDSLVHLGMEAVRAKAPEIISDLDSIIDRKIYSIFKNHFDYPDKMDFKILKITGVMTAQASGDNSVEYLDYQQLSNYLKAQLRSGRYASVEIEELPEGITLNFKEFNKIKSITAETEIKSIDDSLALLINKNFDYPVIFNKKNINSIKELILRFLNNEGYSFAKIDRMDFDENHHDLFLHLNVGFINKLDINGNDGTNRFLILREIDFSEGSILNTDNLLSAWENMVSTGLFTNVEIIPFYENDSLNVDIEVEEAGTQTVRLGGRVDNIRKIQAGIELIQDNLFNFGSRLSIRGVVGERDYEARLTTEVPRLLQTMLTFKASGYYVSRDIYDYATVEETDINTYKRYILDEHTEEFLGVNASVGMQVERKGRLYGRLRLEKQRHYSVEAADIPGFYNISTLKLGAIFDSENRTFFPTEGRRLELSLETTFLQDPSLKGFSKAEYYHRMNFSINKSHTIVPSFLFGYADETLPLPEFFSLGGQDNFFGLRENEERGRQIIRGSLKYRYQIPWKFFFDTYVSLRYDLGAVWGVPERIHFADLKHGVGATAAFDTPVGPAEFSVGKSFFFVKNPNAVVFGETLFYFRIGMKM